MGRLPIWRMRLRIYSSVNYKVPLHTHGLVLKREGAGQMIERVPGNTEDQVFCRNEQSRARCAGIPGG